MNSHGTNYSKGCLITLGNKLECKLDDETICCDPNGRYIILDLEIQGSPFIIVNSYARNYESSQVEVEVEVLKQTVKIIENMDITQNKRFVFGEDFNVLFSTILDSDGGNPKLKVNSWNCLNSILESYDVCDIWQVRQPNVS